MEMEMETTLIIFRALGYATSHGILSPRLKKILDKLFKDIPMAKVKMEMEADGLHLLLNYVAPTWSSSYDFLVSFEQAQYDSCSYCSSCIKMPTPPKDKVYSTIIVVIGGFIFRVTHHVLLAEEEKLPIPTGTYRINGDRINSRLPEKQVFDKHAEYERKGVKIQVDKRSFKTALENSREVNHIILMLQNNILVVSQNIGSRSHELFKIEVVTDYTGDLEVMLDSIWLRQILRKLGGKILDLYLSDEHLYIESVGAKQKALMLGLIGDQ